MRGFTFQWKTYSINAVHGIDKLCLVLSSVGHFNISKCVYTAKGMLKPKLDVLCGILDKCF